MAATVTTVAAATAARPSPARKPRPDVLVLSGGGIKGLATMGALDRLRGEGLLDGVRTVVGTSAGALVGALVATKRDLRDALGTICSTKYVPDFDFSRLAAGFGLDSGRCIESLAGDLLGDDREVTFGGIRRKYGVELVVCVANVTRRRAEYMGPDTHPDMPVLLAIRMSCSVPIYFAAVQWQDCWYVDGSIVDNFPCDWAIRRGAQHVLGVSAQTPPTPPRTFEAFVAAVVESATSTQPHSRASILELRLPAVTGLHFGAPPGELTRLFFAGMEQADAFVKKSL